jgi:predicted transcriptional regulator
MSDQNQYLLALSARIVAAHAGHNRLESDALPSMIRNVFNTLSSLDPSAQIPAGEASHTHDGHDHEKHDLDGHRLSHAHNGYVHPTYGQTVFGDHLVCMEDGLSMKMLKRHLLTVHGMTPDEYRARWGLPESYPMVAAEYARLRSTLARESGLGLKPEDRPSKGRRKKRRT